MGPTCSTADRPTGAATPTPSTRREEPGGHHRRPDPLPAAELQDLSLRDGRWVEGYFYGTNGLSTTPGETSYEFRDVTLYDENNITASPNRPISDEQARPAATWVSYDAMQVSRGAYVAVCCGMTTGAGANQGGNLGRGAAYILSVDKADLATEQKIFVFRSSNLDFSQGVDYNTIQVDAESKLSLQVGSAQHLSGVAESADTAWQYRDFNDLSVDDSNGIEPRHLHTRFVQYLSDKIDARVKGVDVVETTGTKMVSLPASFSTIALGTVPDLKAYIDGEIGTTDTSRGSYVDAETPENHQWLAHLHQQPDCCGRFLDWRGRRKHYHARRD